MLALKSVYTTTWPLTISKSPEVRAALDNVGAIGVPVTVVAGVRTWYAVPL